MALFLDLVRFLCNLLIVLIIVRALLSWFILQPTNAVLARLYRVTDLILWPLRRIIPRAGPVDFSPLVAVLLLYVIAILLSLPEIS